MQQLEQGATVEIDIILVTVTDCELGVKLGIFIPPVISQRIVEFRDPQSKETMKTQSRPKTMNTMQMTEFRTFVLRKKLPKYKKKYCLSNMNVTIYKVSYKVYSLICYGKHEDSAKTGVSGNQPNEGVDLEQQVIAL